MCPVLNCFPWEPWLQQPLKERKQRSHVVKVTFWWEKVTFSDFPSLSSVTSQHADRSVMLLTLLRILGLGGQKQDFSFFVAVPRHSCRLLQGDTTATARAIVSDTLVIHWGRRVTLGISEWQALLAHKQPSPEVLNPVSENELLWESGTNCVGDLPSPKYTQKSPCTFIGLTPDFSGGDCRQIQEGEITCLCPHYC